MSVRTILEELKKAFKDPHGDYVEIFVNPTPKELKNALELTDGIRWAAKNKKLYVFPSSTIHASFLKRIGLDKEKYLDGTWLTGALEGRNRFSSDAISYFTGSIYNKEKVKILKKMIAKDWDWINKYLPGFKKWWDKRKESIRVRIDSSKPY